jgi:O-antigen ligase
VSAVLEVPVQRAALSLGNQLARFLMGLTVFLWGTTQIAPPGALLDFSVGKMGVGDFTFAMLAGLMITTSADFRRYFVEFVGRARVFTALMLTLCALGVISSFTNSVVRDINVGDIIEVARPAYYLFVAITASFFVRLGYAREIAFLFAFGIIAAGVDNMYMVLTGGIELLASVLQLYNRNVVGNLLAIALVYLAIAFHHGIQFRSAVLVIVAMVLVLFSFSKGAWVMGLIGLGCFAASYLRTVKARKLGRATRVLVRVAVIGTLLLAAFNVDLITKTIQFKIDQSFSENQSQSTVALRVGHMYSSLEIASRNPLLGVGVTNFEAENNKNEYWLNDVFLVNDNPHNGFFYVLSCMGIPALLVFLALVMFPVALLPRALGLTGALRQLFAASLLLILLVSGNFMLHLLSHYFLWLLSGLAIGLTWHQKEATAAAAMPRL